MAEPDFTDDFSVYSYEDSRALIKEWSKGSNLDALVDLLSSHSSRRRALGAYYLTEIAQEVEGLNSAAEQLADDALPECRRAFVQYVSLYRNTDDSVLDRLCDLATDLHL